MAMQYSVYGSSLKDAQSTSGPALRGGRRVRYRAMVTMFDASMMNPMMRIVQGKPMRGKHCWTIIGKMTPPVQDPKAVNPSANARLRTKYVDTSAMEGQNCKPFAIPRQTPCERKTCHSFVDSAKLKIPTSWKTAPAMYTGRKRPASVARPVKVPIPNRKKTWMDPIQEIVDGAIPSVFS